MATRLGKMVAWLTVGVGALIVVVLLGGMAALQTPQVRQWLSTEIKNTAASSLGVALEFDDLSGSIIGGLRVKNVALSHSGKLVAKAGELSLGYSIFSLLGSELEISSVFGREVWVDLPGVTGLGGGGEGGGDFSLEIKRIILLGGSLEPGGMMGPVRGVSSVRANCTLRVASGSVVVQGKIDQSQWEMDGYDGPIGLAGSASLDGDKLALTNLHLASGGAAATGAVDVDWSATTRIDGKLAAEGLDKASLPWPQWLPPQAANAEFQVAGPYNAMDIRIGWPGLKALVKGHLGIGDELLSVEKVSFTAPWGALHGGLVWRMGQQGVQGLQKAELVFEKLCAPPFILPDLPKWAAGFQLNGKARIDRSGGNLTLDLGLGNCCLTEGVDVPELKAYCSLEGENVGLNSMNADLGWGQLQASGTFDAHRADLDLTLRTSDLGRLALAGKIAGVLENVEYHGEATLRVRMNGPWKNPALKVNLQSRDVSTPNLTADYIELNADIKDPADKPTGTIEVKANGLISGDVDLDTGSVTYVRETGRSRLRFQLVGARIKANGTLTHGTGTWLPETANLTGLELWHRDWAWWKQEGSAKLTISKQGFAASGLVISQNGQEIMLDGKVDLDGPVDAELRLQNIAVATFQSLTGDAPTRGRLSGRASLSGTLAAPVAVVNGVVDEIGGPVLPDCDFRFKGRYGEDQLDLSGEITAQRKPLLTFSALMGLHISLRPPVAQPTEKGITARLWAEKLPLEALSGYLPWIYNPRGTLSVTVDCRGSWGNPDLKGSLVLKNGSFIIPQTGQGPRDINVKLELAGRTIHVRQCSMLGSADSKPLTMAGKIDLPWAQEGVYDLSLDGQDVKVSLGDLGWVRTSVNLALEGPMGRAKLSGKIEPFESKIRYHMLPSADMNEVVIMEPGVKPPPIGQSRSQWKPTGWLGGLAMDVTLGLTRGLRVDMEEGWFVLGGAMTVKKQSGEWIRYGGRITLDSGRILLYGRRIELVRGTLDFGDKYKLNPDIDLEAQLSLGTTKVFAVITGSSDNPSVHLSSQPPMDQADLLATIVFGRPASELSGDQQNYLSAQAIALLGFQGSQAIRRIIGPQFAPDVITVHDSAQYGASLEAGKYIGEDLYLRYRKNLSSDGGQSVGLEYQLNPHWSLESQVGDTRDTGMDVFYGLEWGK